MGIVLSEDPYTPGVDPETPAQHATEGVTSPSGASLTFTYDLTTAGIPREAQRLISTSVDYGFDHLQASGASTNLGKWFIDTARSKLYSIYKRMIRFWFITVIPDAGMFAGFVNEYVFPATGNGTTITLSNYSVSDARDMGGAAITPYSDYVFSDPGGSDLTLINGCSIGDSSATITVARGMNPSLFGGNVTIVKPTTFPHFPLIREDRTLLCERKDTGWVAKATYDSDETFSMKRIAYPLVWTYYAGGKEQFQGTFRVTASETNVGDGQGVIDITGLVLGATPDTGYDYPDFPAVDGSLKFRNDGAGFKSTLSLAGVTVPTSKLYIKIEYCEEIVDPAIPDADTISPTQTSCKFDIIPPSNAAINSYTGTGDILDVIDSGHFCTQYASLNAAEVAEYAAYCNNSTCRFFAVHNPYMIQPSDINNFWSGRGNFITQAAGGGPFSAGRHTHDGLLTMIGFPVYEKSGLPIAVESITAHGVLVSDTTLQDSNNFDIMQTWQEEVDDSASPIDRTGLIASLSQHTSKKDPAGGTI